MFRLRMSLYEQAGFTLIFIDESGFSQSMPRIYGYSPEGERCYGTHDWQAKGRINAIGALAKMKLITLSVFQCNINADVFHAWVTQDLLPKLEKPSVIVMDNASFHKRNDIKEAITDAGHILEWLPCYSPDLNPIEKTWAAIKSLKRKLRCTNEELFRNPTIYA